MAEKKPTKKTKKTEDAPVEETVAEATETEAAAPAVDEELAREAMRLAAHKLPVKAKFVMREDGFVG